MKMRSVLAGLVGLLFATQALAQAQVGAGQVLGNSSATLRPARSETVTSILDRALGSTRGAILERGAAGWAIVGPGTAGLPWVSAGVGADPLYQVVGVIGGGTGINVYAIGDIICASGTTTLSRVADVATGNALISGGVGACPTYGKIGISTHVSGLGTGVATALAINTGSNAGSFITYNGPAGTPSAIVLTNGTGLPIGGVTGMASGCDTWLVTASSANLRACITDESGTGAAYFQSGDLGTPSAGVITNLTGTCTTCTANTFTVGSASNLNSGTLPAARTNGHMNGTATNDNAAAGEVGEYMTGSASPALTTAVSANCGQITLTAGDWEVYASGIFSGAGATVTTNTILGINNVSATLPAFSAFQYFQFRNSAGITDFAYAPTVGPWRVSITGASQTWYCVAQAVFTVSTYTFQGAIRARRER